MKSKKTQENNELRRAQVKAFEDSDMSAKDWCEENFLNVGTLRYWQRKLREERAETKSWVEIATLADTSACTAIVPAGYGPVTVRIGAFSIEVTRSTDSECLRRALSVAASLC